jgi:exosortase
MSFAFSFLIFMIPTNFLESIVAFPMRILVTNISAAIAHLLGIPVILQGTQMYNPQIPYHYDVAPACSGIRSLMAIMMISLLFGYITQDKLWKKTFLFAAGIPLAIIGNIVRVTAIVIAAQCFGKKAGDWVHDSFGFLIFAVVILLLMLCGKLLNFNYRDWFKKLTLKIPS